MPPDARKCDAVVEVGFRYRGEQADGLFGIGVQCLMIAEPKIQLKQLQMDREPFLFCAQGFPELIAPAWTLPSRSRKSPCMVCGFPLSGCAFSSNSISA